MDAFIAAIVSAGTSVVIALASIHLAARQQRRNEQQAERRSLNATYLNPLRFQVADSHYRLWDLIRREVVRARILVIKEPAEISLKDPEWFNGAGNFLASSLYMMACMFAHLKKVREDIPYLRISSADDTRLVELILRLQIALLKQDGVQYATQTSIGEEIWLRTESRLRTYREFCQLLQDPESRIWMDRLLMFYLDTGRGEKNDRALKAVFAMQQLVDFLDECVGGGKAITSRWAAEDLSPPAALDYDTP